MLAFVLVWYIVFGDFRQIAVVTSNNEESFYSPHDNLPHISMSLYHIIAGPKISLSIYLTFYQSIYLIIHQTIYLSNYLIIYLSTNLLI